MSAQNVQSEFRILRQMLSDVSALIEKIEKETSLPLECPSCGNNLGQDRVYGCCSEKCFREVAPW
jgi:hypothetical protein